VPYRLVSLAASTLYPTALCRRCRI